MKSFNWNQYEFKDFFQKIKRDKMMKNYFGKIFKKVPDPIIRLFVVFILFSGVIFIVKSFIIPSSFFDTELHKKLTIEMEQSREIIYAGSSVCVDCHEDEYDTKRKSNHANLACETCHGAALLHSEDPLEVLPLDQSPKDRDFCQICHNYNLSRPMGFAQINPIVHNPLKRCSECHDPHNPKPLTAPYECSACHTEIARAKAISHHVQVECLTCHQNQKGHNLTPRQIFPTTPTNREFCGKCHDDKSKETGIPSVDLLSHGEKYLCWQCHYPHLPEAR